MPELEPIDRRILHELSADSRVSNAVLAERVGLSASSCWRRVRALEESGAIRKYTIAVNDQAAGFTFKAIVHVHLTRHDPDLLEGFIGAVRDREEIRACHATTGQSDYHLHVVCRDLDAYNRFLETCLFRLPAVASAQTNLILRTLKE